MDGVFLDYVNIVRYFVVYLNSNRLSYPKHQHGSRLYLRTTAAFRLPRYACTLETPKPLINWYTSALWYRSPVFGSVYFASSPVISQYFLIGRIDGGLSMF